MSLNPNNGAISKTDKPVDIPDVKWQKPVTLTQAKDKGGERAIVTYVGDGDSASLLRKDGTQVNCRIDSIDAPETAKAKYGKQGQAFSRESQQTLEKLIENKEVTLRITKPATTGKNYDRALCQIEVEGKGVDKSMLEAGAAWLYRRYANNPELAAAEEQARTSKKGLWADLNAENPESFRRRTEGSR